MGLRFKTLSWRRNTLFFVVGHPRSGTNWACSLLNRHPDVCCVGEFHFHEMLRAIEKFSSQPWQAGSAPHVRRAMLGGFHDMVRKSVRVAAEARKPSARVVGDRTPRHLEVMVPGSAHIVCVRDGRDVLVSWTFHLLTHGGAWLSRGESAAAMSALKRQFDADRSLFERHPERLLSDETWVRLNAGEWNSRVLSDLAVTKQMDAESTLGRVAWVAYERLHLDAQGECRRLFEFLGVDPNQAAAIGQEAETRPGYTENDPRSFFRSGRVGDWCRYFDERVEKWFWEVAGEAMRALADRGLLNCAASGASQPVSA